MRVLAPLLLGLALLAPRGGAAPCSPALDGLAAEVEQRAYLVLYPTTAAQRSEKKALGRVRKALGRASRSFRRDAATLSLAGRTLLDLYAGQPAVEDLVGDALDGLREDLLREHEDLLLTAGEMPGGESRDRVEDEAYLALVSLAEDGGADPLDVEERCDLLGAAALFLEKGFRRALPGTDGRRRRTPGDEMWVEQDGALLWRADEVTAIYDAQADVFRITGSRNRKPVEDSLLDLVAQDVTGVGTFPLGNGTGTWREVFTYFGIVEEGTLVITALDKEAGTIEGTFAFKARGCVFHCATQNVTGGKFRLRNLVAP